MGEPWGLNEHHRITIDWQDETIETLADLLRPGLRAVCIGINPSPISVEAGHYYQGQIGRRFWQRLQQAGLIDAAGTGREDDAAFLSGIGFTDIVKRQPLVLTQSLLPNSSMAASCLARSYADIAQPSWSSPSRRPLPPCSARQEQWSPPRP